MEPGDTDSVIRQEDPYQPLDKTKSQVRLLKLLPADDDQQICCIYMGIFDLDDVPSYTALSYCWGEASPTYTIIVNGHELEIRQNLHKFLLQYRKLDDTEASSPAYLWIDQICIRQSDTTERNHQVGLMSSIYSGAEQIIAWLGSKDDLMHTAPNTRTYYSMAAKLRGSIMYDDLRDVGSFFENRYFSRLWIVQELWLAKRASFLIGDEWLRAQELMRSLAELSLWDRSSGDADQLYELLRGSLTGQRKLALNEAIASFVYMECSDPRDRVYALLGMVYGPADLTANYSKTADNFFIEVHQAVANCYLKEPHHGLYMTFRLRKALIHIAKELNFPPSKSKALVNMIKATWVDDYGPITNRTSIDDFSNGFSPVSAQVIDEYWWFKFKDQLYCFSDDRWRGPDEDWKEWVDGRSIRTTYMALGGTPPLHIFRNLLE